MRTIVLDESTFGWRARLLAAETKTTPTIALGIIAATVVLLSGEKTSGDDWISSDLLQIASDVEGVNVMQLLHSLALCEVIEREQQGQRISLTGSILRRATADQRRRIGNVTKAQRWRQRQTATAG